MAQKQIEMFSSSTKRKLRALHQAVGDAEQIADAVTRPGSPIFVRIPHAMREALDEQLIAHNRARAPGERRRTLTDEIVERLESSFGGVMDVMAMRARTRTKGKRK